MTLSVTRVSCDAGVATLIATADVDGASVRVQVATDSVPGGSKILFGGSNVDATHGIEWVRNDIDGGDPYYREQLTSGEKLYAYPVGASGTVVLSVQTSA